MIDLPELPEPTAIDAWCGSDARRQAIIDSVNTPEFELKVLRSVGVDTNSPRAVAEARADHGFRAFVAGRRMREMLRLGKQYGLTFDGPDSGRADRLYAARMQRAAL